MQSRRLRRTVVAATVGVVALAARVAIAAPGASSGPSSSEPPYVVRSEPGIVTKSIITVGSDTPDNGYGMVGIPDGLGAYDNGDNTFTVLMNHELGATMGVVRAHGAKGAFTSKWRIRKGDLRVLEGSDLIQNVATWNTGTSSYNAPAKGIVIGRLCSADLPVRTALYNPATGKGYDGRIFMNGEEVGSEGRAFGTVVSTGVAYELPYLGKFSWENSVAHPNAGDTTVVVGTDDSTPGQVYVYAGTKTTDANPVAAAGLTNGKLYGVKVAGVALEFGKSDWTVGTSLAFTGAEVSGAKGAALEADSDAKLVTEFERPEDGAWDPRNAADFYFVMTSNIVPASGRSGHTRLWRLRFTDPTNPALGGMLTLLVDGPATPLTADPDATPGPRMFDNMTIDDRGGILIQEDTGETPYRSRVWLYEIDSGELTEIARHDAAFFRPGEPGFFTLDEESSGIIPAPFLGQGWYLADVQAHPYDTDGNPATPAAYANQPAATTAQAEYGQLLALHVPPGKYGKKK